MYAILIGVGDLWEIMEKIATAALERALEKAKEK